MKLVESKLNSVEYDFKAGYIRLYWDNDVVELDKAERHALMKVLKEMALDFETS